VPRQNPIRPGNRKALTVKSELARSTHNAPEIYENEGRLHFGEAQVCHLLSPHREPLNPPAMGLILDSSVLIAAERKGRSDVDEIVAAKALWNHSEPQLSTAWPQHSKRQFDILERHYTERDGGNAEGTVDLISPGGQAEGQQCQVTLAG
jgi:hypothetical protein